MNEENKIEVKSETRKTVKDVGKVKNDIKVPKDLARPGPNKELLDLVGGV